MEKKKLTPEQKEQRRRDDERAAAIMARVEAELDEIARRRAEENRRAS